MSSQFYRLFILLVLGCMHLCGQGLPDEDALSNRAERSGLIRAVIDKGNEAQIHLVEITQDTKGAAAAIRRAIERANEKNADAIILKLTNPTMDIIQARLAANDLREFAGPFFVFIDAELSGAALLLALSADKIYFSPQGSIAYAPVKLESTEKELKLEQIRELRLITRSEFRAAAQERGHDVDLATTLADPRTPLNKGGIEHSGQSSEFRLNSQEACSRFNDLPLFGEAEVPHVEALLKTNKINDYKLQASPESFSYTLAHKLLPFLPLLWIGIMMGLLFEMNTPGFGVGGSIGSIGLIFCLYLQYTLGLASGLDITLIIVGIGLLGVEVVVLPGFGVAGISGIISFTFGIVMSFINLEGLPDNPVLRNNYLWESSLFAIKNLSLIIIGSLIFGSIFMYLLSKSSFYQKVVLNDLGPESEGLASELDQDLIQGKLVASLILHSEGLTLTDLHPVGAAKICGIHLDVISRGEHIASQTKIIVTEIEGNRVVVEKSNDV